MLHRAVCATYPPTCERSVGGAASAHETALTGLSRPLKHSAAGPALCSGSDGAHGSLCDHETGCCTGVPNLRPLGLSPL